MPPGSGIPVGQPYPNFPYGHTPNEYPIYQPPQKQQPADTETEQTPQPDQQEQPQNPTNTETESDGRVNSAGTSTTPQAGQNASPSSPAQPAGQKEEGRKFRPLFAVLGVVVLIAAIGGTVALTQRDKVSEIDRAAVDNGFVDGTLVNCELGEEFYESVAWKDVYLPFDTDDSCSGWVETTTGDIRVDFFLGAETLDGNVSSSAIEPWDETSSSDAADPWCMMTTDDPALTDLVLSTAASCEPLHPIASKLSDLSSIAAGEIPSDYGDNAVPTPVNIAGETYSVLISGAAPMGSFELVWSKDLKYAGMELTDVEVTRFGSEAVSGMDDEICVDAILDVGEFRDSKATKFNVPYLAVMNPAGQVIWLEQENKHYDVEEYEEIDLTYCGVHSGHFRHATHLLVSYDEVNDEFIPAWKFDIDGETGL